MCKARQQIFSLEFDKSLLIMFSSVKGITLTLPMEKIEWWNLACVMVEGMLCLNVVRYLPLFCSLFNTRWRNIHDSQKISFPYLVMQVQGKLCILFSRMILAAFLETNRLTIGEFIYELYQWLAMSGGDSGLKTYPVNNKLIYHCIEWASNSEDISMWTCPMMSDWHIQRILLHPRH